MARSLDKLDRLGQDGFSVDIELSPGACCLAPILD
jgi:hypothetical protein